MPKEDGSVLMGSCKGAIGAGGVSNQDTRCHPVRGRGVVLHQIPKRIGGFAGDRLLSPSLSSTPSGGEGARRAGEEVP